MTGVLARKEYFEIFIAAVKKVNNTGAFQISLKFENNVTLH